MAFVVFKSKNGQKRFPLLPLSVVVRSVCGFVKKQGRSLFVFCRSKPREREREV